VIPHSTSKLVATLFNKKTKQRLSREHLRLPRAADEAGAISPLHDKGERSNITLQGMTQLKGRSMKELLEIKLYRPTAE
jgi:hypothetical protein